MPPKKPKRARSALTPAARAALRGHLQFYRKLREMRGSLTAAQFRELHRLLANGAEAFYRLADRVERDPRVRVPGRILDELAIHAARVGPAGDPVIFSVREVFAELREWRPATPRDLRAAAIRLLDLADDAEDTRLAPVPYGLRRRLPPPTVGRPRNWILEQILNYATRAHVRALLDHLSPRFPHTHIISASYVK